MTAEELVALFGRYQFTVQCEAALQAAIEKMLLAEGIAFDREKHIGEEDRPDFLVGDVAIEVKVDGSWTQVSRQLQRYLRHSSVQTVILVTTRANHTKVPRAIGAKRIHIVPLFGL